MRARVFIDFWNFQLGWNDAVHNHELCDWRILPKTLVQAACDLMTTTMGSDPQLTVEETIVHASVEDGPETKLRDWLTNFLDRQPSYDVKIRTRKPRQRKIYCKNCQQTMTTCSSCGATLMTSAEKGVDAALVTDLLSLAWQRAYDVAVLVSGDADYIPAVEYVQEQGLKVINASWASKGHHLRGACWGSFEIDSLIPKLTRS
jgi:uncharacterized LabA/DUF88 family protein